MTYLRDQAWQLIAPGFCTLPEVITGIRELAEDDTELDVDPDDAETQVRELWAARLAHLAIPAQRQPSDDARLTEAFKRLTDGGLVAEMNCGFDRGEATQWCIAAARRQGARGYVYFHGQDTARLAYPDPVLFLGFDAVPPPQESFPTVEAQDAATIAVGNDIARALADQQLTVRWDGSAQTRLSVVDLDWRRPLPG
ncbi:hypothetical protein D1871_10535 [Nakamurella silvestris]|nr:hypothetical protein D1871_10535 [Nakamurella silvestris]